MNSGEKQFRLKRGVRNDKGKLGNHGGMEGKFIGFRKNGGN